MKDFIKTKSCLHVALYATFGGNVESLEPSQRCCSNCAKKCKCNGDTCAMPELPFQQMEEIVLESVRSVRKTSQENKDTLYEALKEYQQTLNGQNPALFHSSTSTGFTDSLISQIVENCANIFTTKDLETYPFFKIKHALAVLELIQEIFEDIFRIMSQQWQHWRKQLLQMNFFQQINNTNMFSQTTSTIQTVSQTILTL